ncbi:hypothetical protein DFH07DRAFT_779914 [Mycena maculata]|uniref:Uncharacterized protein n=1 Tax=Mycena maculata TaxID=230809 RepID=A0AAD7I6W9_9AGAR|nr:hypothetical protein DFH07DRAFT_779914 [Mycena maculata]
MRDGGKSWAYARDLTPLPSRYSSLNRSSMKWVSEMVAVPDQGAPLLIRALFPVDRWSWPDRGQLAGFLVWLVSQSDIVGPSDLGANSIFRANLKSSSNYLKSRPPEARAERSMPMLDLIQFVQVLQRVSAFIAGPSSLSPQSEIHTEVLNSSDFISQVHFLRHIHYELSEILVCRIPPALHTALTLQPSGAHGESEILCRVGCYVRMSVRGLGDVGEKERESLSNAHCRKEMERNNK